MLETLHDKLVFTRRVRVLAQAIAERLPRDAHVLDVGCGSGDLARAGVGAIARAWTRRGPETRLAQVYVDLFGATDVENLLEGITRGRYHVKPAHAPLVFRTADEGDLVAQQLVRDAARDLGDLAIGVIRQLHFEPLEFEVVMAGSFFKGHPIVGDLLAQTVSVVAPAATEMKPTTRSRTTPAWL